MTSRNTSIRASQALHAAMAFVTLGCAVTAPGPAEAQALHHVQPAESPLVLKSRGSFFIGGEQVEKTAIELGGLGPADQITVNQMYVEYMVADGASMARCDARNLPVASDG